MEQTNIEHESKIDINKTLAAGEYLNKIKSYLEHMINNPKKLGNLKIQLTIANNFISSKDNNKEYAMHSKSDNIKVMINDEQDKL